MLGLKLARMGFIVGISCIFLLTTSCDDEDQKPPPPIVIKAADYSPIGDAVKFIGLCLLGAGIVKTIGVIISTSNEKH